MAANNITLLLIYTIGVCRYCTIVLSVSTDREYCALLLTNDSVLRQKKIKLNLKKRQYDDLSFILSLYLKYFKIYFVPLCALCICFVDFLIM